MLARRLFLTTLGLLLGTVPALASNWNTRFTVGRGGCIILTSSVLVSTSTTATTAAMCPFCPTQGQTLSAEVNQADFIVLGTVTKSDRDPNDFSRGWTNFTIETVVKPHEYLAGKKTLVLPRYVQVDVKADENRYLIFCSLYTRPVEHAAAAVTSSMILGNYELALLDAYRGEKVPTDNKLGEYLKGAIEVRQKDPVTRLKYFFNYLDSADLVISSDAMNEFGYAEYKDVRVLAEKLPADKVLEWLKNPNTPASRFGLYGLFMGHCGKKEHAKAVRELLDSPDKVYSSGLDGMIASYVLLDPKEGWDYLAALLKDPAKEFPVRYAGLKVLRFFWEFRPDVVSHEKVLEGMKLLIAHSDLADLPIEDLRKWGCWSMTDFVLKYANEPSHNTIPIVKRSILRFAIAAPNDQKKAKEYVEVVRAADPERVKFIEETLRDEMPKTTTAQDSKTIPPGGGSK